MPRFAMLPLPALLFAAPFSAQALGVPIIPVGTAGRQPVLAEHASGGEVPMLAFGASVLGVAVYDIVTAPASARWYNLHSTGGPQKSEQMALRLSLISTAVPLGLAVLAAEGSHETAAVLIGGGIIVGPSVGHFYAERPVRALRSLGARLALTALMLGAYSCCT